jgi:hypothetical protein
MMDATEAEGGIDEKGGEKDSKSEDDECEELVDLPPEITKLLGEGDRYRVYTSEEELQRVLEKAGVGDLRVVLVEGKPRLVVPSHQHNAFTTVYANAFTYWSNSDVKRCGQWGVCSATHRIDLPQGRSRDPDLSYWGYPHCIKRDDGSLKPTTSGSIPDVVIQFSWKNTYVYEVAAINDMMNRGLEEAHSTLVQRWDI